MRLSRLASLVLALSIPALALAGCATSQQQAPPPAAAPAPAPAQAGQSAPAAAPAKKAPETLEEVANYKGSDWEQVMVEGAKKNGSTLTIYTVTQQRDMDPLVERFTKKYPFLKVEQVRSSPDKLIARLVSEHKAGQFIPSVVMITTMEGGSLPKAGLALTFSVPNKEVLPEGHKGSYWTSYDQQQYVFLYNTNLVPKERVPKTYEDLLDPWWKGKLGLDTEDEQWFGQLKYHALTPERAQNFFSKLAKQDVQYRKGHTLNMELTGSGELPSFLTAFPGRAEQFKADKMPLDWVPLEPVIAYPGLLTTVKNAPNPHAGLLFINWMLAEDGGQKYMAEANRVPANPKVPSKIPQTYKVSMLQPEFIDEYDKVSTEWKAFYTAK